MRNYPYEPAISSAERVAAIAERLKAGETHRGKRRNGVTPICAVEECEKEAVSRGWCARHYSAWRWHGDPLGKAQIIVKDKPCTAEDCNNPQLASGLCSKHWQVKKRHGDANARRKAAPRGSGTITGEGYRLLRRPGHPMATTNGNVLEHRLVMSEMIGRPLTRKETVHHKNGNRLDNRPENLELWANFHCDGQRVEDMVRFAREILTQYGDLFPGPLSA